jgi:hypothetical protein
VNWRAGVACTVADVDGGVEGVGSVAIPPPPQAAMHSEALRAKKVRVATSI